MKKLLWLGVIAFIFSCKPTDVTIILTVDTQELYNNPPPPKEKLFKNTILTDDHKGRLPKIKGIEFYKSKVFKNHQVTWVGVSQSPDYTVAIDKIEMVTPESKDPDDSGKKTSNFFDDAVIDGRGGKHSIVRETVNQNIKGKYYYTLYFTVHEEAGAGMKSFEIDPQLKAHH